MCQATTKRYAKALWKYEERGYTVDARLPNDTVPQNMMQPESLFVEYTPAPIAGRRVDLLRCLSSLVATTLASLRHRIWHGIRP